MTIDLISSLRSRELHLLLEKIVSHLNIDDVENAMKVNNSWRNIFLEILTAKWKTKKLHPRYFRSSRSGKNYIPTRLCQTFMYLALSPKWIFVSQDLQGSVQVINRKTRKTEKVLPPLSSRRLQVSNDLNVVVHCAAFMTRHGPPGLAADHIRLVVLFQEGKTIIWNQKTWKMVTTIHEIKTKMTYETYEKVQLEKYPTLWQKAVLLRNELLTCVNLCQSERLFVLRKFTSKSRIVDVAKWTLQLNETEELLGFDMSQSCVLVHISKPYRFLDLDAQLNREVIELHSKDSFDRIQCIELGPNVRASQFTYHHPFITMILGNHFKVWDVRNMQFLNFFGLNPGRFTSVTALPNMLIVTHDNAGKVQVWDLIRMSECKLGCNLIQSTINKCLLWEETILPKCEKTYTISKSAMAADLYGIFLAYRFNSTALTSSDNFYWSTSLNVLKARK